MSPLVIGEPVELTADQLYEGFRAGLQAGKSSHHMATNYQIQVQGDRAELWGSGNHAVRTHRG